MYFLIGRMKHTLNEYHFSSNDKITLVPLAQYTNRTCSVYKQKRKDDKLVLSALIKVDRGYKKRVLKNFKKLY